MILSVEAEKAFDKIQPSLMIKTLSNIGMEGKHLSIIKAIHDEPQLTSYSLVNH